MNDIRYTYTKSPHGDILLARSELGITHILFQSGKMNAKPKQGWQRDTTGLEDATDQLRAYFDGRLERFELPLAPQGTDFQRKVWDALVKIPCGETVSYAEVADRIGQPKSVRAVASANARNKIAIVIPCHRVIGSDGKLRGYAGGLHVKAALLDHEWTMVQQRARDAELASAG